MRAACERCGWIHAAPEVVVAGSRFVPDGVRGYRAATGGPVRSTRLEAMADVCAAKAEAR